MSWVNALMHLCSSEYIWVQPVGHGGAEGLSRKVMKITRSLNIPNLKDRKPFQRAGCMQKIEMMTGRILKATHNKSLKLNGNQRR